MSFLKNNLGLFFSVREKVINNFKSRIFRIKNSDKILTSKPTSELETVPFKLKKSKLKLQQELMNEILANKKVMKYFGIVASTRILCF